MLKSLNIDPYVNGYNVTHINCLDLSIAAAAGHYCYNNYFYYCFYYSIYKNWEDDESKDYFDSKNKILEKLGLRMSVINVNDKYDLVAGIKSNIDERIPSILIVKYNQLFYDKHYLDDNYILNHALLISDYNTEKPIIGVREYVHNRDAVTELTRADIMARLALHEDMIADIWDKSNISFKENDIEVYNKFYKIEKVSEPKVNNYHELIMDFIRNLNKKQNILIKIIDTCNEIRFKRNKDRILSQIRRDNYNTLTIFFEIIEKSLSYVSNNKNYLNKFENIKADYMNIRDKLLSKIVANIYRNKDISNDVKKNLKESIIASENELFLFLQDVSLNICEYCECKDDAKLEPEGNLHNLSCDAIVTADSEYRPCNNVINSKRNSLNDFWVSLTSSNIHWLTLDFKCQVTISKFVIEHSFNELKHITKDFQIQGSNDGIQWNSIVVVENNYSSKTIHDIKPTTYRYFRLFITLPSFYDNMARICKFEAWG